MAKPDAVDALAAIPDEKLTAEQRHLKELRRGNKGIERIAEALEMLVKCQQQTQAPAGPPSPAGGKA